MSAQLPNVAGCSPLAAVAFLAPALLATSPSAADVVKGLYVDSQLYNYKITHMPDLDQRRATLPAEGGMYCVPTATLNIFGYAANHGYPDAVPEPANWQLQSNYGTAGLWIWSLGGIMNTDPIDGTDGQGKNAGIAWMLGTEPLLRGVIKYRNSQYTPTVSKVTKLGCQGWAMSFLYGKYQQVDSIDGVPVLERIGGHAVTLTRSYRVGDTRILRYRDPADDYTITTQSEFINKERTPYEFLAFFGGVSPVDNLRSMTVVFSADGKKRFIDSLFGIRPMFGLSFSNGNDSAGGGTVQVIDPIPFEGSGKAAPPPIIISSLLDVLDFAFDADFENALVIAQSNVFQLPSRLRTLDLTTGDLTIMQPAPSDLQRFATDRHGHIYAFDSLGKLYRLAADGSVLNATSAVPLPSDVAVDDEGDTVWILSVSARKLVRLSQDFSETLKTITIPILVPMSGDGMLMIDPTTGTPWFKTDANDKLYGVTVAASGAPIVTPFESASLTHADSVSFGDDGELFVLGDGVIKVLKKERAGGWTLDPRHPFNGLPGGTHLSMLHNSTNFDPNIHSGPGWSNIHPAELDDDAPLVDDCPADLNADELIDASDLAILLGAWGSSNGVADVNQDGTVGGPDLALLLGAWGICSP